MKLKTILALGCSVLAVSWVSRGAIVADWTFEAGTTGNPPTASGIDITGLSPASGTGIASGHHASAATVWDNPAGNGSAESLSANNWSVGDYFQFKTSTSGYNNIKVAFSAVGSNTGPRDFGIAYSSDGINFTTFGTYSLVVSGFSSAATNANATVNFSYDFSSVSGLNNDGDVYFRLVSTGTVSINGGTVATGGTSRVDDFAITGDEIGAVVPEPSTWVAGALLALPFGVHGVRYLRNRKRA